MCVRRGDAGMCVCMCAFCFLLTLHNLNIDWIEIPILTRYFSCIYLKPENYYKGRISVRKFFENYAKIWARVTVCRENSKSFFAILTANIWSVTQRILVTARSAVKSRRKTRCICSIIKNSLVKTKLFKNKIMKKMSICTKFVKTLLKYT